MTNLQHPIASPFTMRSTSRQVMQNIHLNGKTAIVTGGYSGIGLEITKALVKAGAHVVVPARTLEKARHAIQGLPNVELATLDLMDTLSIDAFADNFLRHHEKLNLLIESAGIMFAPLRRDSRGNESQFSTNYLGHFQLTSRLYAALKRAGQARVVIVTSRAQRQNGVDFADPNFEHRSYNAHVAYAQSKAADCLFAVELDKRAQHDGIRAFAVHPGLIPGTSLGRFIIHNQALQKIQSWFLNDMQATHFINGYHLLRARIQGQREYDYFKTVNQGAASVLWAATSPLLADKGGVFIEDSNIGTAVSATSNSKFGVRPWSIDPQLANQLWTLGEQLTGKPFRI
ncbi:SDR family NAD(P)-dependent oxidoreductase [Pediococcus ethanolidurans]|uniref:SDR family NAD(P)-dependent oxidoreductase n=1 Tax=Pediococcus ethanolidurans TaxID=319653 RepID=UPI002953FC48|nr:SDR family NAD(P)-dependent oxidoreductase [Pediococcus ethanolidurans]MDV7718459.1 SDR family NAD(P)-dependent oxidoreductase [Pediococcus ethanolidurans]